jgi:hypothetical protein
MVIVSNGCPGNTTIARHPMQESHLPFNFTEFARSIYTESARVHPEPFLLPACYGGEQTETYEALFVLEAPSVPFTERRWCTCGTVEAAIQMHREVFIKWAYRGKPAQLFTAVDKLLLNDALPPLNRSDFFRRYYVTDLWKDAAFKDFGHAREYQEYWLSKLAVELNNVSTRRMIFIGKEAAKGASLAPASVPVHFLPFPGQWRSADVVAADVQRLIEDIRIEKTRPDA